MTGPVTPDEIDRCQQCRETVGRWKAQGRAFDWSAVRVVHVIYHGVDAVPTAGQPGDGETGRGRA